MRTSKIFTNGELKVIEEFKAGNRNDKTGLFCRKIKPKIKELRDIWFLKIPELNELIKK